MTGPSSERTADADVVRGGIDSLTWLVNNACNWQTERWEEMRDAAWKDRGAALAALDRLVACNQQLQEALAGLTAAAEQYLDTDRGDLDGWIDQARAALASVRARTPA